MEFLRNVQSWTSSYVVNAYKARRYNASIAARRRSNPGISVYDLVTRLGYMIGGAFVIGAYGRLMAYFSPTPAPAPALPRLRQRDGFPALLSQNSLLMRLTPPALVMMQSLGPPITRQPVVILSEIQPLPQNAPVVQNREIMVQVSIRAKVCCPFEVRITSGFIDIPAAGPSHISSVLKGRSERSWQF